MLRISLSEQHGAKIGMQLGHLRIEHQPLSVGRDRIGRTPGGLQGNAEIVVKCGMLRRGIACSR